MDTRSRNGADQPRFRFRQARSGAVMVGNDDPHPKGIGMGDLLNSGHPIIDRKDQIDPQPVQFVNRRNVQAVTLPFPVRNIIAASRPNGVKIVLEHNRRGHTVTVIIAINADHPAVGNCFRNRLGGAVEVLHQKGVTKHIFAGEQCLRRFRAVSPRGEHRGGKRRKSEKISNGMGLLRPLGQNFPKLLLHRRSLSFPNHKNVYHYSIKGGKHQHLPAWYPSCQI